MRKLAFAVLSFACIALFSTPLAVAQVPSVPGPYNIDIGAVLTDTANVTTPRTSANQSNTAYVGVVCTYVATAGSGSASVSISIDAFDAATNSWRTLVSTPYLPVTNSGSTGLNTRLEVAIFRGALSTSPLLPNMYVANVALPRVWRVSRQINGTLGPALTGKVGCNYIR